MEEYISGGVNEEEEFSSSKQIDRLSSLPDDLRVHILSFMGDTTVFGLEAVKEAAMTTSLLSKSWQHLWTDLPTLRFCEESQQFGRISEFVSFVNNTLKHCRKSLEEFTLNFYYNPIWANDVDLWLDCAIRYEARTVCLWLLSNGAYEVGYGLYKVPVSLFSSSLLRVMTLYNCRVAPGEGRIELKSLTKLEFVNMELHDSVVENIISGCPVLSSLIISVCWGLNSLKINSPVLDFLSILVGNKKIDESLLEITAPYLRVVHLRVHPSGRDMRLRNMSSLVEAKMSFVRWHPEWWFVDDTGHVIQLFESLWHVEQLLLEGELLQFLSAMVAFGQQLPQSTRVTRLELIIDDQYAHHNIFGIVSLLQSCPKLETLYVHINTFCGQPPDINGLGLSGDLSNLKHITMKCNVELSVDGRHLMLVLVRNLLKRSVALREMQILPHIEDRSEFEKIAGEVLSYPKSSPKAVIQISYA